MAVWPHQLSWMTQYLLRDSPIPSLPGSTTTECLQESSSSGQCVSQHALQLSQFTADSSPLIGVLLNILTYSKLPLPYQTSALLKTLSNIVLLIGYPLTVAICIYALFSYHCSFNRLEVIPKVIYCHLYMAVRTLW